MSAAIPVVDGRKLRRHTHLSTAKSCLRIIGFLMVSGAATLPVAAIVLIVAEAFGIADEVFGA